jgi:ADP-heptose:LPS heptosyltransferase
MTHVLAVRLDNDGDVLLAGPAIRALAHGADRVTLLCGPRGRTAAQLLPGVDAIVCWRAPWIDPEPDPVDRADIDALVDELAALRIDRAVIFGSFHQSPLPTALLLRLAGVPCIAATSVDYPGALLDVRHGIEDDVHEVERSLDLARAAGFTLPDGDDGRLRIRRDPAPAARPFPAPYIVVHPGASVPARAWAPERCAELVQALADRGRNVAVTGAPSERALCAAVAGPPRPEVRDLAGTTSLAGLADVIDRAACIVVGNTGPAHLAAAVGTPVVSLYALTVPAVRWRPWAVPQSLLSVDVPCAGCRARVCPVEGHPCVGGLATAQVLDAVDALAPPEAAA